MNVLVTGGGGFLGRALTERLLVDGHAVTVLGRNRYLEVEAAGAVGVAVDLTDAEAVARACQGRDLVFHVAAKAGIWGDPDEYRRANVEGTGNVLEGCRRGRVSRLVYTSSPSVTFDGQDAIGADESLPYATRFESVYAATKAEAERMVLAADDPNGLRTIALRPHLIWGPRDPHIIPRVVAAARAGRLMQVGDGKNQVDITYIDNAVEAHVRAAERIDVAHGRAYFISQGEPVQLWPWINGLLERLGAPRVTRSISLRAARTLGAALECAYRTMRLGGEPRMTRFLASQLGTTHYYDISAARRDLGYQPLVPMEEGLKRLLASGVG